MSGSQERDNVWETYVRSWKVTTDDGKRALLEASLSPDCLYQDPLVRAEGWDDLVSYALDFHARFPGAHFVTQRFMAHDRHGVARWEMQAVDGSVLGDGISYVEFGEGGKIAKMIGFFETPA